MREEGKMGRRREGMVDGREVCIGVSIDSQRLRRY